MESQVACMILELDLQQEVKDHATCNVAGSKVPDILTCFLEVTCKCLVKGVSTKLLFNKIIS